ncbi:hypothetical protein BDY19DRAFT_908336 [Irpex rosettiformis]|uniref:Uncharacterized protein n=1 Tax=Irpex rosettiformis TaxID=378272 RepID=A0ACB8TWD8_9APHY|nr:hypothetical protein BDY19DRAFT_908336 [Irpex rosettiformis]
MPTLFDSFSIQDIILNLRSHLKPFLQPCWDALAALEDDALITVITPTESRWPTYYHDVARRSTSVRGSHIELSLSHLWNDILDGKVEFLRLESSLPDLMTGRMCAYGWKIRLRIGFTWSLGCKFHVYMARLDTILKWKTPRSPNFQITSGTPQLKSSDIYYETVFPSMQPVLMLDDVPYSSLAAYIRAFQESLDLDTSAIVGFSAMGSSALPNSQSVMASLPFLPRKYVHPSRSTALNAIPPSARRTLTPVLTSLESILQLLSSGPQQFIIDSVQNASDQYARYLQDYAEDLVNRSFVRDKFVNRWGMEGWREEVLMGQWEAALFSAGILKRWLVVVRK